MRVEKLSNPLPLAVPPILVMLLRPLSEPPTSLVSPQGLSRLPDNPLDSLGAKLAFVPLPMLAETSILLRPVCLGGVGPL